MSVIIQGNQLRDIGLGRRAAKTQALSAATLPVFTIAGGEVLITSLYLRATVAITTDGGTLALQSNPTTGDTAASIVTATDLGTTDTAVGTLIGVREQAVADASAVPFIFHRSGTVLKDIPVSTGQIELVGAAAINGTVEVVLTWIPLTDGATLVAA